MDKGVIILTWKAIIFDLDGTLLDTIEDLADSMNLVLDRRGLPVHPVEKYNFFVGDGVEQLARRALPGNRQDEERRKQTHLFEGKGPLKRLRKLHRYRHPEFRKNLGTKNTVSFN